MDLGDTIAAISSPAGAGERAIVRLSGPEALAIADRVFVADDGTVPSSWSGYTARPGRLEPPGAALSLPSTLYLMRAPRSYTREDVVEFHVGAWPALVEVILERLLAAGARGAEPGEFTCRALLGGRLDLAQAEAVMAVVDAGGEAALKAAGDLLRGHLSREVLRLVDRVREVLALVEADLDFSDQDIELVPPAVVAARVERARDALADLGRRSRGLETFGGEVRLVLAGWPNVGKSSLFNRLLQADRAIVTPEAGTTRDELRAALHLADPSAGSGQALTFVLSDTAGLDEADDELAGKARAKALEAIGRADLVLLVLDATAADYDRTEDLLALVAAPMVVAVAKCDLAPADRARAWLAAHGVSGKVIPTSARTGQGIEAVRGALVRAVEMGDVDREARGPVLAARHRAALEGAATALARAARVARRRGAGELVALELREALEALGEIVGRPAAENLLDEIFSRFCIGK